SSEARDHGWYFDCRRLRSCKRRQRKRPGGFTGQHGFARGPARQRTGAKMIIASLLFAVFLAEQPIQTAQAQFDSGNYKAALNTLNAAIAKSPNEAPLHFLLARCHYELREYDQAVDHSELAVKLDPQNAEYSRWLGRAYGAKAEQSHSFFLARKVKQAFEA